MIRQGFNLIEIALAIAIIAIGLSSILVLFPVGLNAANSASADNQVPDISDYILGYMECQAQTFWRDADNHAVTAVANSFLYSLKDTFGKITEEDGLKKLGDKTNDIDVDAAGAGWTDVSGGNGTLYKKNIDSCPVFYYRQKYEVNGTPVTDVAAVVLVWIEPVRLHLRKKDKSPEEVMLTGSDYAVALCAEISFPADKPYAEREKYLFRREIYNQAE